MMPLISLVLIDSDGKARNDTLSILKSFGNQIDIHAAADAQEGTKIIQVVKPQIVMLDVKDIEQGVRETSFLVSSFPFSTVFVTAGDKNPDWILKLIRAGAGEYLTKPVVAQELAEAVKKVARLQAQKSGQNGTKGAVISVYNPSGGMGTTTIAVNLAATLAASGGSVALVDLNLISGDTTAFLDLAPRYTLANVTAKTGQLDASFLRSVLVPHSSGVQVLNGPADLVDADRIQPEQIREVIAILQRIFEYIIIDTGGPLFGCNLAVFNLSDRILFTTVLSLPALKNATLYLMAMDREGSRSDRVKLVVNRHHPKDDIKLTDAEKILATSIYLTVPNAYVDVRTSINKGIPLVICCPRSPAAKAIEDLARQLTQETIHRDKPA